MDNYFYKRFLEKNDDELNNILKNSSDYQKEALEAASIILRERELAGVVVKRQPPKIKTIKRNALDRFADSLDFSAKSYFRTFSGREIFTAASLGISMLATMDLVKYYGNEEWIQRNLSMILYLSFLLFYILNHILYKVEHKRRNQFTGRYLQGLLFFAWFTVFSIIETLFFSKGVISMKGDYFAVPFMLAIVIFCNEVLLSFINRFFRLLKWHPW